MHQPIPATMVQQAEKFNKLGNATEFVGEAQNTIIKWLLLWSVKPTV